MNRIVFVLLLLFAISACRGKKKDRPDVPAANFLVNDYIRGQVAQLDTSHFSFFKVQTENGRSDTTPIKNSDIRFYAQDFLNLPDLSKEDIKDDYEVSHLYDDLQGAFIFTYTTRKEHPVKEQHVTVEPEPDSKGNNNIRSVYVDLWAGNKDSTLRKNMMWETDNFYITTTLEVPGQPEKIKTIKILWNGFENRAK